MKLDIPSDVVFQRVLLSRWEVAAVLDLVFPGEVVDTVDYVQPGVSSLLDRGLVAIQGEKAKLSEELVAVIEPIVTRVASLNVIRTVDLAAEEYFFNLERGVRRMTAGDDVDEFEPFSSADVPNAVAASLAQQAVLARREPVAELGALVDKLAAVLEAEDLPRPDGAAGLVLQKAGSDQETIITVLLHDAGFTWIRVDQRASLSFVETKEDLAELVADLIGIGVS